MSKDSTLQTEQFAAAWLIRRQSGSWTETDQAELDGWLAASSLNMVAYLRLELAWEDSGRLKAIATSATQDSPPRASELNFSPFFDASPEAAATRTGVAAAATATVGNLTVAPPSRQGRGRQLGLAAGVLLMLGITAYLYVASVFSGDRYSTPVGGIASVPIADGSKVTLNTDSLIRVTLADRMRRVQLDKGEAFFQVAKDPTRPFVVVVGSKKVIAVGTEFSVRRDEGDIQVVVTEGKVRIEAAGSSEGVTTDSAGDVFLTPGNIARASDAGVMVQTKTLPEVEQQLTWRTGVLTFRKSTLAAAALEFNRYNVQKIVIDDPTIAALPIEGNFRATNVGAFAHLLANGYPISVTEEADRIVLKAR
jgi:transmembrane sensor